ncbi:hypothetical protein NUW58_g4690 [Xylaria curta]|uniref:Uncharacterized protein n=1 Tax=Xylaria curta TaxID=42375 RepID=A0ACC1P896_9PEZI|nr:hypothetical protein NUW58_g4690 [Xylaria curta]
MDPEKMDEDYASEDDSDFAPGAAPADDGSESESGSEVDDDRPSGATPKRKRTDAGASRARPRELGDEAILQKGDGAKRKRSGLVTTPGKMKEVEEVSQNKKIRAQEKAERKSHAVTGPVTIDVDDIWAQMIAAPLIPSRNDAEQDKEKQQSPQHTDVKADASQITLGKVDNTDASGMIKIKRTYNFAGKVHTEEKLVARDSAEAKLYLASQDPELVKVDAEDEQPKRKPRKAFRSIFEPVIEGLAQRTDLKLGMNIRLELREQQAKAKKLNVVEKSRMDWAGFVDKEGIKDELELAGKSKESYVSRQDFLRRVEAKKDEEARLARMAGRG